MMMSHVYLPGRSRWLLAAALLVMALDQLSKYLLMDVVGLAQHSPIHVTKFFSLVMVWNYGISFGMFAMPDTWMPLVLLAVSIVISLVLWVLAHRTSEKVEQVCYVVIIGGALGNAVDRVRFGAVADFFYFHIGTLGWPAFNIADASIFCGVAVLLLRSVWLRKRA